MFGAHFYKKLQISTLFLNTWKCSLEHDKMSHARFDNSCARFDMFRAHFEKNLQISTLFLTLGIIPLNILTVPMHVSTTPVRALTCSAHILTKTCKFQHYF